MIFERITGTGQMIRRIKEPSQNHIGSTTPDSEVIKQALHDYGIN